MALLEVFVFIQILIILVKKWASAGNDTLQARKVPHDKPKSLLGNIKWSIFCGMASNLQVLSKWHQQFKSEKIYGIYQLRDPIIFIRDLDLIHRVTVKDFHIFSNRKPMPENPEEIIFARSLFALNDQKWHEMRNTLTPPFRGSEIHTMLELINNYSLSAVRHIERQLRSTDTTTMDIEIKDFFTRFTNDVIASTVFGANVNSFKDKSNEFYVNGQKLIKINQTLTAKRILIKLFPKVMKLLGVNLGIGEKVNFFKSIIVNGIIHRTAHDFTRPDMIHMLIEAKQHFDAMKKQQTSVRAIFTDEDILAQCLLFFFAGFETVSTCLFFTTYELAMNPEKQQLLYEEIEKVESTLNGKPLNYDALTTMNYMNMVILESLRKWPPAVAANRVCCVDHKLIDNNGNVVIGLKKGDRVYLPIYGLHHDPENFYVPSKFIPERFSAKERHKIKNSSYIPFGAGPRSCLGSRLAIMKIKAIIYYLFLNFKFIPNENTPENVLYVINDFNLQPKTFWLKAKARI